MPKRTADELTELADKVSALLTKVREPKATFAALSKAAEEVGRSWSGSNIGHHARVYYGNLEQPPPQVQFSPEWGLMRRMASNRPDSGWQIHDHDEVIEATLRLAKIPDIDALEAQLKPIWEGFLKLKEEAVSILTTALNRSDDKFLQRKLGQIEKLRAPDVTTLIRSRLPSSFWSRDTLALSKGAQAAPHQCVAAIADVAETLEGSLEQLEASTREAAGHLGRIEGQGKTQAMAGSHIFVGHGRSPVWRELKEFLVERLGLQVDEFNSESVAGIPTAKRLEALLNRAAFAFLVMTAEDEHADGTLNARLNVVHEVGLFQGRLGFTQAIVLLEEGCEEFSNIHGLGQIRFPTGNISAKFEEIRRVLEREHVSGN